MSDNQTNQKNQKRINDFVFNIARRYINTKRELNVSVKQVVNAIYNDKFLVNLIRDKLIPEISNSDLKNIIDKNKVNSSTLTTFNVDSDDNVVELNMVEAVTAGFQKKDTKIIDTVRIIWFNNLNQDHLGLFDVLFGGSESNRDDLNTSIIMMNGKPIPVLFSLQYFLNNHSKIANQGNIKDINNLEFVGEKLGNSTLLFNQQKIELLKKNIIPLHVGSGSKFVGPVYIKYIYQGYLFITGAFYDDSQDKSHIFTLKLGNDHIDLEGNQNIKQLIDNTLNEFYKHLNIQISFNLSIDLLELLKFYTAILSKTDQDQFVELTEFSDYFKTNEGLKCKRFITKVYDLFMEKSFTEIPILLPSAKLDTDTETNETNETTLIKNKNNKYIISVPCNIYTTVEEEKTLLPLNMKNILIPTFLGFNSKPSYPKILDSFTESTTINYRSPIVTTQSVDGGNIATYISPLQLYNGSTDYIIHDIKNNN